MTHVDDFIDDYEADPYARWVLMHFRLPADLQIVSKKFLKDRLYCTRLGQRWQVVGASTMGDVWLHSDLRPLSEDRKNYYEMRVSIDECSDWGPTS